MTTLSRLAVGGLGICGICGIWLTIAAPLAAQTFPAAARRSFAELKSVVTQNDAETSQQVHLQWFAAPGQIVTGSDGVRVVQRTQGLGPLPRERDPQLSPDHLVVISSDEAGREVDWRIVPDPRLIRGEFPDEQGRLSGRLFQRTEANLLVDIPDRPDIMRLRVYETEWNGDAFALKLIATAEVQ